MDTTFKSAASRHNIHFVKCGDCHPNGVPARTKLADHLGLQFWSLRHDFEANVANGLDETKALGFTLVETAGTYGLKPTDFRDQLMAHGLKAVAAHLPYERLKNDLPAVIGEAKSLGVEYVVIPWLPQPEFDAAAARAVAADFNAWGSAIQAAGMKFAFHPHGYEFHPIPGGSGETPFDLLVSLTKPGVVSFEMDVFWVAHAGVDPARLLARYPDRWTLLHVKDLRKGGEVGVGTRSAPAEDHVAVGTGQLDWSSILHAAKAIGVEYYFIEDETAAPLQNIPVSVRYLQTFKY
jgi:sugar phosphate isomerase/epimerase